MTGRSKKQLAQKIKVARVKMELTQKELAKKSGVNEATINFIENGKLTPRALTIEKIANACNVKPETWLALLK